MELTVSQPPGQPCGPGRRVVRHVHRFSRNLWMRPAGIRSESASPAASTCSIMVMARGSPHVWCQTILRLNGYETLLPQYVHRFTPNGDRSGSGLAQVRIYTTRREYGAPSGPPRSYLILGPSGPPSSSAIAVMFFPSEDRMPSLRIMRRYRL